MTCGNCPMAIPSLAWCRCACGGVGPRGRACACTNDRNTAEPLPKPPRLRNGGRFSSWRLLFSHALIFSGNTSFSFPFLIQILFCCHQVLIPVSASTIHGGESRGYGIINLLWADPVHLGIAHHRRPQDQRLSLCVHLHPFWIQDVVKTLCSRLQQMIAASSWLESPQTVPTLQPRRIFCDLSVSLSWPARALLVF